MFRLQYRSSTESEGKMNNVLIGTVVLLSFFGISMQGPCNLVSYTHRGEILNPQFTGHPNFRLECRMRVSVCFGGCSAEHQYRVLKFNAEPHNAKSYCNIAVNCCTASTAQVRTDLFNCVPVPGTFTGTAPPHSSTYHKYVKQAVECTCISCMTTSSVADCNALHA